MSATAQAPYVGRPYVYRWRVDVDEPRIVYASPDFTFCYGSFEYAQDARNGHDTDTPVWP